MCGARSSLSFQISYLIESNQVGQEEFEHISKQSAQRVVLQAVSMYDNKVPQSQQVQKRSFEYKYYFDQITIGFDMLWQQASPSNTKLLEYRHSLIGTDSNAPS